MLTSTKMISKERSLSFQMDKLIAFTVDVDPDLNLPSENRVGCVSKFSDSALFDCCARGLSILTELFEDAGIQATLFFEGRTASKLNEILELKKICKRHEIGCHGLEHEDFTCEDLGRALSYEEKVGRIRNSKSILKKIFGKSPEGFRAPYLHADVQLLSILEKENFIYDSSIPQWDFSKWKEEWKDECKRIEKLIEFPLPFWRTTNGKKIYSYLWPMHEGEKEAEQYLDAITAHFRDIELGSEKKERVGYGITCYSYNNSPLPIRYLSYRGLPIPMLATHPWHIVTTYSKGQKEKIAIENEVKKVRKIIENIQGLGCKFLPLKEVVKVVSKEIEEVDTIL